MLAFARRQELSIAPVNLVTLVSGMEGLIERAVGPSVSLHTDIPADLPCVAPMRISSKRRCSISP